MPAILVPPGAGVDSDSPLPAGDDEGEGTLHLARTQDMPRVC